MSERAAYPLSWPDGWVKTRPQKRRANNNWRKTFGSYRDGLISEVERMGATSLVLSTNTPLNLRGLPREGFMPPDPGVAVYFTRTVRDDFDWQDFLELSGAPSIEQIDARYRDLSKKYHPDVRGGDVELFRALVRARDSGHNWVLGKKNPEHEYVLACDLFNEVRLNMHAIALTVEAMRQIDRCGASSMLERAFRGFQPALAAKGSTS